MQSSHTDQFDIIIEQLVNLNIEKAKAIEELEALNIEEDALLNKLRDQRAFSHRQAKRATGRKRRERILVKTNLTPSINLQQSRPSPNRTLQRTSQTSSQWETQ